MDVAVAGGNELVVLGAFGCGIFDKNPEVVARVSKEVVAKYADCFEVIEFAIYCSPRDEQNYESLLQKEFRENMLLGLL